MGTLGNLELDLIEMRPQHHAVAIGWPGTLERLQGSGLAFSEISDNWGRELAQRAHEDAGEKVFENEHAFGSGSMEGYFTYGEILDLLDRLSREDSDGILTACDTLGYSVEGRPIVALGLFNQSRPAESRPEVLYTALTHGREPMSMQAVLYFLCTLVEGYGRDPRITYLVNERELWFVPVVNPDAYVRNETTWRHTGAFGFWRKNLRDNDEDGRIDQADGVDLNRNFGFCWGFDDFGSSPHPASQVYRGPEAFSEPETRALRDFCRGHAFVTADNVHAYYEATLYPWGHAPESTPDGAAYERLADQVTRDNGYAYGFSDQVLYPVNGDADDWLYGDQVSKPKCFSMTSEIGSLADGFWPPPSRMLALARENLGAFESLALGAGDLWQVKNPCVITPLVPGTRGRLALEVENLGLGAAARETVQVQIAALYPGVHVDGEPRRVPILSGGGTALLNGEWTVEVAPEVIPGVAVPLEVRFDGSRGYESRDTVEVTVGPLHPVFVDDGSQGLRHWIPEGLWGREMVAGNSVFSDSPGVNYPNGCDAALTLAGGLDLSGGERACLRFRSRWNIECAYDFALVEASPDSGATWIPLSGRWTVPGRGNAGAYAGGVQPPGDPGYQGNRRFWKTECIDLSAFAGNSDLRLRFRLTADAGLSQEGWQIDDIMVATYGAANPLRRGPDSGLEAGVPSDLPASPGLGRRETRSGLGVH